MGVPTVDMKKPIDLEESVVEKKQSAGMYCNVTRLLMVGLAVLALFIGSMLITFFMMKNHVDEMHDEVKDCDEDTWPDPWGDKEPITLEEYLNGYLSYKIYRVTWIDGENAYLKTENGALMKYSAPDFDAGEVYVSKDVFDQASGSYHFSSDMRYMLFELDKKPKWTYSFDATYKIYDRQESSWYDFPGDKSFQNKPLQLARWTGGSDSGLAFVHENSLYYQASPVSRDVQRIEEGDVERNVFAGHPDWAYENQLFFTNKAFWGSNDGNWLAYGLFDESHLPEQEFSVYGDNQYSKRVRVAYPKPAQNETQRTSEIKIKVWNKNTMRTHTIPPPSELHAQEHYVTSVSWKDDSSVIVIWTNRLQKQAVYTIYDVATETYVMTYHYEEHEGWVDPAVKNWYGNDPQFAINEQHLVDIFPKPEGHTGNWRHIGLLSSVSSGQFKPTYLTKGEKEVSKIVALDRERNLIYYQAIDNNGNDVHVYRVGTPDAEAHLREDVCITCDMECDYADVNFASTADYYILSCMGKEIPWHKLMRVDNGIHKTLRVVEDNSALKERIKNKALTTRKDIRVTLDNGNTADIILWLPPNYDEGNKHPLIVKATPAPEYHWITSMYMEGYFTQLASMEGTVWARIGGRGSRGRGDAKRFQVSRSMGTVEIEDHLLATKWIVDNFNIDASKVASMGTAGPTHFYNSFANLHALAESQGHGNLFKCALTQNPVTDFRQMDAVWAERHMGKAIAADNLAGYEKANVIAKVDKLKEKKLFILSGTADETIPVMNTARLMKALNDEGIEYKALVMPDYTHRNMKTRHAYKMWTKFFIEDCFGHKLKDKSITGEN